MPTYTMSIPNGGTGTFPAHSPLDDVNYLNWTGGSWGTVDWPGVVSYPLGGSSPATGVVANGIITDSTFSGTPSWGGRGGATARQETVTNTVIIGTPA